MARRSVDPPRRAARARTVGQLIADSLARAGVEWAFTVPGESFIALLDALPKAGIRVVATRHEGGAAFMAEAVGQLTGRPAAVLGTRAVGASNMAIGIHTALQNSTPMAALVGQVQRAFVGREAFQEADLVGSFGRLAKWACQIEDASAASNATRDGMRQMVSGRPGPVLFSLPEDVLDEPVSPDAIDSSTSPDEVPGLSGVGDESLASDVVRLLAGAKRPAILAGGGVLRSAAVDALVAFSERVGAPVFAAWRRPTVFPNDHAHYLGMTGYGAAVTVRKRLAAADALLVIGCRLNEIASFGYEIPAFRTKWAHVDVEPREARAGLRAPDLRVVADAREFLEAAIAVAPKHTVAEVRREQLESDRRAYVDASTLDTGGEWRGPGIHPGKVIAALQRVLPASGILTTDAGNFGQWLARGFRFGRQHGFLGATSGAMGYGLPAAVAASLCEPGRPVVALCGDGGFAMTMNELETAQRTGAKPVVLVFDNRRYGTISMYQRQRKLPNVATELGAIDFAAVARACGAQGGRVTRDAEFEPALRDALAAERPALIHLEMDPRWISVDRFEG